MFKGNFNILESVNVLIHESIIFHLNFFFEEPVLQVTSVTFLEYVIKSDNSGPVYSEILAAFPGDPDKCILET